jgi:hypothetical protein
MILQLCGISLPAYIAAIDSDRFIRRIKRRIHPSFIHFAHATGHGVSCTVPIEPQLPPPPPAPPTPTVVSSVVIALAPVYRSPALV